MKAERILRDMDPIRNVVVADRTVTFQAKREQVPEMNARLVQAHVRVYAISVLAKTLEDQFLEMTRSDQIG